MVFDASRFPQKPAVAGQTGSTEIGSGRRESQVLINLRLDIPASEQIHKEIQAVARRHGGRLLTGDGSLAVFHFQEEGAAPKFAQELCWRYPVESRKASSIHNPASIVNVRLRFGSA